MPPPPDPDRLLVAQLFGTARHHARYQEPTEDETAAAVAELQAITRRPDLLAEVAGILIGAHAGKLDEARAKVAAGYCIAAGADPEAVQWWVARGKERRALADLPPFGEGRIGAPGF